MRFSTAISCMDGRILLPVVDYMKNVCGADYVDMITEAGPNKILSENVDRAAVESLRKKVGRSVVNHGSKLIAVVGHHDCSGNILGRAGQAVHIQEAIRTVQSWGYNAKVIGLWVDENWTVEEL